MKLGPWKLLFYVWVALSTLAQIIALASITDDIILWSAFVQDLIASYRIIAEAIWGNLFAVFRLDLPQAAHDYLTINSLFSLSVAWGLARTSDMFSFGGLGSFVQVIRNNVLDVTIGGNTMEHSAARARELLALSEGQPDAALEKTLAQVSRPIWSVWTVLESLATFVLLAVLFLAFSFAIPFLLRWRDDRETVQGVRYFATRRAEISALELDAAVKAALLQAFDETLNNRPDRDQINALYHGEFQKSLISYVAVVLLLFLLCVFANFIAQRLL